MSRAMPPSVPEYQADEDVILNESDMTESSDEGSEDMTLDQQEWELDTLEEVPEDFNNIDDDIMEEAEVVNVVDNAEATFRWHSAGVFGCAFHPFKSWAATGSEDDSAFIWDWNTGDVLFELNDHKDTVTDVHFNHDGNYLVTGDMAGEIFLHKVLNANNEFHAEKVWQYSMGDMTWMQWHYATNVLFAGSALGDIYVWRLPGGECKILPSQGVRCDAGSLTYDGKKLFVAYQNGDLRLWDIKDCVQIFAITSDHPMAHKSTVISVACDKELPLYMSGDQDGKMLLCSNNGVIHAMSDEGPIESIAISPATTIKLAASATLYGKISIWDLTKHSLRLVCEPFEEPDLVSGVKWINDYMLIVATTQGPIYGYDARNGKRIFTLSGHLSTVYEMSYSAEHNILLTACDDSTAKIFQVPGLGNTPADSEEAATATATAEAPAAE